MYTLICDGGCKPSFKCGNDAGHRYNYGSYLILHDGVKLHSGSFEDLTGPATNNIAEYNALIKGLECLLANIVTPGKILVMMDSQLVLNQVGGSWKVRKPHLRPLRDRAQMLLSNFEEVTLKWTPGDIIESYLGH